MHLFSERIKLLRDESKLTQSELAKILCVSQQTVSAWESAKSYPDALVLYKIAIHFNVSADYLLGIEFKNKRKYVHSFNKNTEMNGRILTHNDINHIKLIVDFLNFKKKKEVD